MNAERLAVADELARVLESPLLRALTEPSRLELLKVLILHGPADVGTLADHLPQERSGRQAGCCPTTHRHRVRCSRRRHAQNHVTPMQAWSGVTPGDAITSSVVWDDQVRIHATGRRKTVTRAPDIVRAESAVLTV
jgi:hypothetical protein